MAIKIETASVEMKLKSVAFIFMFHTFWMWKWNAFICYTKNSFTGSLVVVKKLSFFHIWSLLKLMKNFVWHSIQKKNPFFLSFILCEWFLLSSSSFISPQTKFSIMLAIIHPLIFVCTRIRRKRMNMQKKSAQNLPEIKAKEKMRTFNLKTLQY